MRYNYIYALIDPRTNKVKYIGRSSNPQERWLAHFSEKTNEKKYKWMQELKAANLIPEIKILERCEYKDSSIKELVWIKKHKDTILNLKTEYKGNGSSLPVLVSSEKNKVRREVWLEKQDIKRLTKQGLNNRPRLKLKPYIEFILQQKAQEN